MLRLLTGIGFPDGTPAGSTPSAAPDGLPFTRAQFESALAEARQSVAGNLEVAYDLDELEETRWEAAQAAFGQRVAIQSFADLIGDNTDNPNLDPFGGMPGAGLLEGGQA